MAIKLTSLNNYLKIEDTETSKIITRAKKDLNYLIDGSNFSILNESLTYTYTTSQIYSNYQNSSGTAFANATALESFLSQNIGTSPTSGGGGGGSGVPNDSSVSTDKIQDGAVTTAKIGNGSVTTAKIGNDAVTTAKIQDGAVTNAKIGNKQIQIGKIADSTIKTIEQNADRNWSDWATLSSYIFTNFDAATPTDRGFGTIAVLNSSSVDTKTQSFTVGTNTNVLFYIGDLCTNQPSLTSGTLQGGLLFQDGNDRRWFYPNANPEQPDTEQFFYLDSSNNWVAQAYNGSELINNLLDLPNNDRYYPIASNTINNPNTGEFVDSVAIAKRNGNKTTIVTLNYDASANPNEHEIWYTTRDYELQIFEGLAPIGATAADGDQIIIRDVSASENKIDTFAGFANKIHDVQPDAYLVAFTEYEFKSQGGVGGPGQIGWTTGGNSVVFLGKTGEVSDLDREFKIGIGFRVVQRNDSTKWIEGKITQVTGSGAQNRQLTTDGIVIGPGGAPDNTASVDINSLGALLAKADVYLPGQTHTGKSNLAVASAEWIRELISLVFSLMGGMPAARFYRYNRDGLTANNATLAQIQAKAIDSNLIEANDRIASSFWIAGTSGFTLPERDNFILYGEFDCEVTATISQLDLQITQSDDRTVIKFYKVATDGTETALVGFTTNSYTTEQAAEISMNLTHLPIEEEVFFSATHTNLARRPLTSGEKLRIKYGFVEASGGQLTGLNVRINGTGGYNPITKTSAGIKLTPLNNDAYFTQAFE